MNLPTMNLPVTLKYNMMTQRSTGIRAPVLFTEAMNHCDTGSVGWEITSAGFATVSCGQEVSCDTHGASDSTKLSPDPRDAREIADWLEFGFAGMVAAQSGIDIRALVRSEKAKESAKLERAVKKSKTPKT